MRRIAIVMLAAFAPAPLSAQRPVPIDTVRVTAGSRLVAGAPTVTRSVDVFDRAAIEALPVRSVSDAIARALGADLLARSPAQADLSLRGSSFEQVLVLIDGVPVNDSQTGHFHLDLAVPLDAVERIEILRGPASAVYGSSAVGGVVNIVTRETAPSLTARAQGGSFGAWAFGGQAGLSGAGMAARVSADHDVSDGHRDGTDHRITQVRAGLEGVVGGGRLSADGGFAARDFGAAQFYGDFDSYEETRSATASVSWRSRPAALVVEPRVSFRQHEDDFILLRDDPTFYRNMHTTRQTGGELSARWQADARVALSAGTEIARASIESNTLGDRDETLIAGFAEAALGDADGSLLTLGLRLDDHSTFGSFVSVSAGAAHRVSSVARLRASAATGFRAPSWTDRYYEDPANIGSPDLQPERFRTAELGGALTAGAVTVDVAGFIRHARDLIDWGRPAGEPDSVPWRTLNVEEATFYGVEATVLVQLDRVRITGRTALLSFNAEESDGFQSKYALQPLTRTASVDVAVPVHTNVRFAVRAFSARRADGESWNLLDARVTARLLGIEVFGDVTNLLDDSWLDVSAVPAPGRAFAAGVRVRR